MKLFIWKNSRTESDFLDSDKDLDFGNHSGCYVILGETLEEVMEKYNQELRLTEEPFVLEVDTKDKGILLNADGEC